jgi:hypothetical protein
MDVLHTTATSLAPSLSRQSERAKEQCQILCCLVRAACLPTSKALLARGMGVVVCLLEYW